MKGRPGLSLGPLLLLGLATSSLLLLGGLGGGLGILLGILLSSHDGTKLDLQHTSSLLTLDTEAQICIGDHMAQSLRYLAFPRDGPYFQM